MTEYSTNLGLDRLINRFDSEPFALAFAGQGYDWLKTLRAAVAAGSGSTVAAVVEEAAQKLDTVADELAGTRPHGFDPVTWAREEADPGFDTAQAAISVPGIFTSQLATGESLKRQGLELTQAVAAIGHSQGILGAAWAQERGSAADILAIAELIGAAITRTSRITGLIQQGEAAPMIAISGITREQLQMAINAACAEVPEEIRPVVGLRNDREAFVLVGRPHDNENVIGLLKKFAAKDAKAIEEKKKGGQPFAPKFSPLKVQTAFHHPAMAAAVEQTVTWATTAGLDTELARFLAEKVLTSFVDWPAEVSSATEAGARWILDLGPDGGVDPLSARIVAGQGVGTLVVCDTEGQAKLFDAGLAPELPADFTDFAPRIEERDGQIRLVTRFSELTGYSPMMLAGMTPTTVDPGIVAAAANAGNWAELAGGGQVTPAILEENLNRLTEMLDPGVNAQFNTMFLNPELWRMHVEGKRLVPKARANGAPIDGIVISAGMPSHEEAVTLVKELRDAGFPWISFKPGAVKHVRNVLKLADAVPEIPIIAQVEGGKAGGHHSWEDLDELLIATYAEIRARQNVILAVGGGIGTPERAADYITGSWSQTHGLPAMPVDAIMIGTAAMATKESTASEDVKRALVETKGIEGWVGAGEAAEGMASGRSQLGADLHEIDNSFAKAGRLLDEVAGDEAAVAARRQEIIEAIAKTAKPYFGELEEFTYQQWLERYLELSGPHKGAWTDVSWFNRFTTMLDRVEARLSEVDHGEFSPLVSLTLDQDPTEAIKAIVENYPVAATELLHPVDASWFINTLLRNPGKPANFVPVIDKDIRRWWRSDSLWQAHDERYTADQVCIIPGTAAVEGITRANEPVAELLERFNQASVARLEAADEAPVEVESTVVERVLSAPGTYWAGRHATSFTQRLGAPEAWVLAEDRNSATHAPTGSVLEHEDAEHAVLTVPLAGSTAFGTTTELKVRFTLPADAVISAVPQVTQADAEVAMAELTRVAAGGTLAEVKDGVATWTTTLDAGVAADYDNVTIGHLPSSITARQTAPDVLVGRAWPAVFAAVNSAIVPGTDSASVVEGMLSLVHLEHHITMLDELPNLNNGPVELKVTATADEVADTDMGRLVVVRAKIAVGRSQLATLSERFAIAGRKGDSVARTNTSALPSVVDTPRSFRAYAKVTAPSSMRPFAVVSGDRNPIHVSDVAAGLAGLPGVIVHGMWTSAIGELIAAGGFSEEETGTTAPGEVVEYTATMLAPVLPGEVIEFTVERGGVDDRPGRGEVRSVTAAVNGNLVLTATAVMAAPKTFYAFPGQGIQSQGMGMDSRASSAAARDAWDRADRHTRQKLGFSVLEIVQNNPTEVWVNGERFHHPDGVLFLTQFTQVAMATLGVAQVAEMAESSALNQRAFFAGHSVGEYNALAAYSGVLTLESVVEIVYRRGLTMHRLVERDEKGNSNYGLGALRPHKIGIRVNDVAAKEVHDFINQVAEASGEFLEIVNHNLLGKQYAIAGTRKGLAALAAEAEKRGPGQRALVMIPGIDVPFHSSHLRDGVDDFRQHLDSLLPHEFDLDVLLGRYIPNLVARPFELSRDFIEDMLKVAESPLLRDILDNFKERSQDELALARVLLIELLAWQFASPVRWIETQDLLIRSVENGGLGVERFVEVGVGAAPTLANMMGGTLALPKYHDADIEVLNVERDRSTVFATDEIVREVVEEAAPVADEAPAAVAAPAPTETAAPTPAPAAGGARPADIEFTPSDATEMLIAIWTKVRPDQMGATDSIETLVEGVSSRRNQLLLDLGVEFGLGAIDGAADAELGDLKVTVSKMAKGYKAFGPVLGDSAADALRRITGPTGKKPNYIAERVTGTWELGQGWANHVVAEVVIGSREGASLRGGDLASLAPASPGSAAELDQLIDAAVQAVAAKQGVGVSLPSAGGAAGGVVDSAALGEFAEQVTGKAGVLAETARTILSQLGLDTVDYAEDLEDEDADNALYDLVSRELGSDWPRQVAPSFDAERAVLIDDRWASAREDLSRIALGELDAADVDVSGAGEAVAKQAEYLGLKELAAAAREVPELEYTEDVAVVTGASPNSIAAAVTEELLAGGATVVVTTSNLNHKRLSFYKELYATSARGKAALWIVPANLSSYTDLDAVIEWIGAEQSATVNGQRKVTKPALIPSLLFPFAAPRVQGTLADAGPQAESQMRLLLWAVERLISGLSTLGGDINVDHRLHVVLPGSPNRGRFGGDGAYGESKAALDAVVTRWHAETVWGERTSLVHALIGWVRGTGLMGGNDPMVEAVEAKGVRTYATNEIAELLVSQATTEVRAEAAQSPVTVDFTGGLGEADINLADMAREAAEQAAAATVEEVEAPRSIVALPTPYRRLPVTTPEFSGQVTQDLEDMIVIVGVGELGPLGSARTRFDAELNGELSAAGVTELAWTMGLIHWDTDPKPGWYDAEDNEVPEEEIYERFHEEVMAKVGVRRYHDDFGMVNNLAPELTTVYLDRDLTFNVSDKATAKTFVDSEPDNTSAYFDAEAGEWTVVRHAGSAIRVPRRMAMSRFVGGQIPEGFDPAVYGIPADMIDNLDRLALWNLVCTVDAFLSSGFTPAELLSELHPARVSSTQGTGMGGVESMRSLYIDGLLAEPRANDILQEALPNVVAAHVMQSYVGGYGQMIHPVAACATAAVSVEEAMDKIRVGKADFVVAGGLDDLSIEGITGFGDMAATADSAELEGKGVEHRFFSRANDRRRAGFIESEGGGTILVARASLAADLGLPVLGVLGFAESFADGAHTSIPAPGLGALSAARGGMDSRLAQSLAAVGVGVNEISIISKHDTSTNANDPNESDLHERIAASMGRAEGNPLYVISQKTLTGHAKGGAAAFQMAGLLQVLRTGQVPANRSLDCVDPVLARHEHLVWLRKPLDLSAKAPKAGLITSLGFGHVSALVALVHQGAFVEALRQARGEDAVQTWQERAGQREDAGLRRILSGMIGQAALYERPADRNLGGTGDAVKEREAAVLLDADARLKDGTLRTGDELK
ncbi:3-oxoacyl-[acyl-carrier-protein] synthase 2 [Corynebacterium occultum]|uniref:3-oxoacyl-[acyl-carrier-protein] synthase 2 n=1 Tax=Corynebacterium occultum TaxID=2675219 RepID=A0A6B8WA51_9CORY|nr:type I polyketide synthase [Corynebacterium occultum]QGU08145.1 3-oxoacyl-[acyl-carrier-protein] synthase 2 [Corynebacterium occultum]